MLTEYVFIHSEHVSNEEAINAEECASLNKPFQEMHFTPRKQQRHTPMKTLPFSPSQVCLTFTSSRLNILI